MNVCRDTLEKIVECVRLAYLVMNVRVRAIQKPIARPKVYAWMVLGNASAWAISEECTAMNVYQDSDPTVRNLVTLRAIAEVGEEDVLDLPNANAWKISQDQSVKNANQDLSGKTVMFSVMQF